MSGSFDIITFALLYRGRGGAGAEAGLDHRIAAEQGRCSPSLEMSFRIAAVFSYEGVA